MLPQMDSPENLRLLGFRCIDPQEFTVADGSIVGVHALCWMSMDRTRPATESEARCLRLYTVYYAQGGTEELDEPDVERLVGVEVWMASD